MFIYRSLSGTQVVDAGKTTRLIGFILIISAVVFVNSTYAYPLALEVAPAALVLGILLGMVVMRSVRFWRDAASNQLWMDAGKTFIVVWGLLIALRVVLSIVSAATASGPHHIQQVGWITLSSSALVASMGLWIARGIVIYRKYRSGLPGN